MDAAPVGSPPSVSLKQKVFETFDRHSTALFLTALSVAAIASAVTASMYGADRLTLVLAIGGMVALVATVDSQSLACMLGLMAVLTAIFFALCTGWIATLAVLALLIVVFFETGTIMTS